MAPLRSFLLVAVLGSAALACTKVRVEEAKGPDGGHWRKITCSRLDQKCFKAAAKMCPNGYYFGRIGGGPPNAAPAAPGSVTKLPPQEEWGKDMYSREPGALLVKCAEPTATASAD